LISARTVTIFGNTSIGVLLILLVLVWTRSLDPSLNIPILVFAAALILSRIVLRVLARKGDSRKREDNSGTTQTK
jgi:hypothetical protein